jgi:hypothetical protein
MKIILTRSDLATFVILFEEHEKRKTARGLFHFAIQCAYACYFVMNPIKAADTVSRNSFY